MSINLTNRLNNVNSYDFKSLNDKEFESLACDLLGMHLGHRFERFKAGRDGGVDGRFFLDESQEVVLQCKHWANTPISQLLTRLSKYERPKIAKLKPSTYYIAITNKLSRKDKQKIKIALSPFVNLESQIYGAEDLNDLLGAAKEIERRHYKLWLHSSSVLSHISNHAILGRSDHTLQEIKDTTARYALTDNHHRALSQLESLGVIIITGEPGIGKTTLANHLCLHYVAQGYQLSVISEDVTEAENILDTDSKQIFYFDDFLGRNYLDALNGHEGQKITQFVRRIAKNKNKRFILTSRSTILNQGKLLIDVFSHFNLQRNEYELKISSLSNLDRAHILYNQIWHSRLDAAYINELYKDGRYRNIILHKNYNPRLINYITDSSRLLDVKPSTYWDFVQRSLSDPADIWENPFAAQQDDFGRAIILLVVLNRQPVSHSALEEAYYRYISLPGNQNMKGRVDFLNNLRTLTGSFLNRLVDGDKVSIDLFNPSIGDYVLERYKSTPSALRLGFMALANGNSLRTLKSLQRNGWLQSKDVELIATAVLEHVGRAGFSRTDVPFVAELIRFVEDKVEWKDHLTNFLQHGTQYVLRNTQPTDSTRDAFFVVRLGTGRGWVLDQEAASFVDKLAHFIVADEEIEECWKLVGCLMKMGNQYRTTRENVIASISNHIAMDPSRFVDVEIVFADCVASEYLRASKKMGESLQRKLVELGLDPNDFNLHSILGKFDVQKELNKYFDSKVTRIFTPQSPLLENSLADSVIDDLFERS